MELIPRPTVTIYHDPLHVVLEHVAKKVTHYDLALVHDDDLARIDGIYDDEGVLQPDAVISHLRIFEVEALHHVSDECVQGTRTEETRVVMFSKELQEWNTVSIVDAFQNELAPCASESSVIVPRTPPVGSPTKRTQSLDGSIGSHTRTLSDNQNLSSGLLASDSLIVQSSMNLNLQGGPAGPLESGHLATSPEGPSQYSTATSTGLTVYGNYKSGIKSLNRILTSASTVPAPSQSEIGMGSGSILVEGYISQSFGPRQAEQYLSRLLKTHDASSHPVSYYGERESRCFVVASVPLHISDESTGRSTWVLDRVVVAKGTVVPQTLRPPMSITDREQHVMDARLQMPIFFEGSDGTLGLSLEAVASGRCHGLVDAQALAPLGKKSTTSIRICWPGYIEYKRQISVRDETPQHNNITISRFAHHIGQSVDAFLRTCRPSPGYQDPHHGDWRMRIGVGGIVREDIVVIGAIHVSAASWMPILQLNRYIL
ncbi:hypothetical protein BC826DRAFT_997978 [Russula brevipes]|nr:hypothetical protein BC826DRAFT_997978 [Russula brevipes]